MLKHILTAAPGSVPPPNSQRAAATGESVADRSDRDPPPKPEDKNRDNIREYSNYREPSRQEPRYEYSTRDQLNESVQPIKPETRNNLINRIEHHRNEYHYRNTDLNKQHDQYGHHRYQNTSRNGRLSVNAVQRLPQPLNVSTLDSSKHSQGGTSSSASPGGRPLPPPKFLGPPPRLTPASLVPANVSRFMNRSKEVGIKEMLTSLGLLCLVSLLLALLSLIFLLKISPVTSTDVRELLRAEQLSVISAEEYVVVYEVTLALCALTLSLNLCCLLVCAVQFLFAVKLVNSPDGGGGRTNKYLQKSAVTRVCAVGGFFISIPVFLTGIILYTFIQFHSTPAIVTSVFIGLGIIFCGCAMVHNVFVWQKEKTNAVKAMHSQSQILDQPIMNSTQNIGTPQSMASMNGNGFLTNGHISNSANTTHGTNMSFHNTTGGTTYSHHPITILPNGPYIIRPSTGTPPTVTVGDLTGGNRPPRPPRPPAPGSVSPPGVPTATLDLSHVADPHELSTLV